MWEIIRYIFVSIFFFGGLFILGVATLGLYRLNTPLKKLHASAKCETMGTFMVMVGLAILSGLSLITLKLFVLIIFVWITAPVATYMIGREEVLTNPDIEKECEVREI
ncbi:MAG: monovalent cation/H(+) antiporter subunit G [Clostridiales bacterium]|jgi:multicomponent Na+:H+ antiporter subunit G|nr:monovalent cation/H(+) antiporter subunit G [Clostridiales bacterium]